MIKYDELLKKNVKFCDGAKHCSNDNYNNKHSKCEECFNDFLLAMADFRR